MNHIEFTRQSPDKLQFYFQGWEPEASPRAVVCLVHGLGEHTGRYAHVAAALNDAGYAVLGCDLRGHGKTQGLRGHTPSYDTLLDDISRLLDEATLRYPGKARFIYGHSLGGNLVLNYALRRKPPLAGVVSTSPAIRVANPLPATQLALAKVMNRLQPTMQMPNGLALDGLARDPEVIRAYTSDPLVHNKISVRLAVEMLQAGEWALAHAAEFPLPLLLVHGSADQLTSAVATQEFAGKVRGDCTLKIWDGFYHETHNEPEKAEVLGFMLTWIESHVPV
ncbi:MAG: lysophospholipase [Anaerolineae bacterium]|jgi:alpha-beta hydrolase superfamily lysophospholipase|nr:lysophospholipase [Anaerolineae bacterium]